MGAYLLANTRVFGEESGNPSDKENNGKQGGYGKMPKKFGYAAF